MHPPTGPEAIVIAGYAIYWYGILIVAGMLLGAWVASKEVERRRALALADLDVARQEDDRLGVREAEARIRNWDPDNVWSGLMYALVFGIIGARLYHVLTPPPSMNLTVAEYFANTCRLVDLRQGGLGLPGAIIGGLFGIYIFCRPPRIARNPIVSYIAAALVGIAVLAGMLLSCGDLSRSVLTAAVAAFAGGMIFSWREPLSFLDLADMGALAMPHGQAVGRWGNFFNQELYGAPTNLPWAVEIDNPVEPYRSQGIHTFHPTFLYESIWSLIVFGILLYLTNRYRRTLRRGDLIAGFLILYPLGRFVIEFFKLDAPQTTITIGGWTPTIAQLMLIAFMLAGVILLLIQHRGGVTDEEELEEEIEAEGEEDGAVEIPEASDEAEEPKVPTDEPRLSTTSPADEEGGERSSVMS